MVALTLVFNVASQPLLQRILFNVFAFFSWDRIYNRIILIMNKYTKISNSNMLWSTALWHFFLLTLTWQPVWLCHMNYVSLSSTVWNFVGWSKNLITDMFSHIHIDSTYTLFSRITLDIIHYFYLIILKNRISSK